MSQRTASGWLLGQPHRALAAAGLLVDHADDEQVAVRGAPARAARASAPRSPRPPSGTSCPERPAAPQLAVDHVARPRVALPLGGRRRARCRRARAGTASARRPRRAGAPPGSGAPRCARAAGPRSPRRRSMPASMLLGRALVAGRVDRVEAHEALEQLGRLALEVVGHRLQATRRPRWAVHRRAREDMEHEPALRHRRRRAAGAPRRMPWHVRWPRACGRDRSTSSSVRSTCSPRARRCAARSSRAARTR